MDANSSETINLRSYVTFITIGSLHSGNYHSLIIGVCSYNGVMTPVKIAKTGDIDFNGNSSVNVTPSGTTGITITSSVNATIAVRSLRML